MFRFYLRSDAQRSEEHKLKKEKELEKEIAASEREDDGGFSMQVKRNGWTHPHIGKVIIL